MIKQIKIGQKDIHFARIGGKVIYPNYDAKENLVLWYDFSGRTNLDVKKGIAEDLSGNGNDGILENFAYESGSGYDSNSYLEFDNVDDFITIPELNLDVNNFTVAVDGEVLSYIGDNVAKINENGLEIGGRNLLIGSKDSPILRTTRSEISNNILVNTPRMAWEANQEYTISFDFKSSGLFKSANYNYLWPTSPDTGGTIDVGSFPLIDDGEWHRVSHTFSFPTDRYGTVSIWGDSRTSSIDSEVEYYINKPKLEKGTIPTDWTPAPEDFQTTKITPIFSNKIKTLMYWNMALTDVELQEVYNVQKHRI